MEKKKVIVVGCGSRGKIYSDIMKERFSSDFELVAIAEPVEDKRNYMKEKHSLSDADCFDSWEPIFEREKFADIVIIATMDRDHFAPAMAAIERGYNLLLEKPIAPTPEECRKIQRAAKEKGVFVLVCHVLRFTEFFIAIKNIIDSGRVGRIMNIQHVEGVGAVHQSHSFVRGNWGNAERSSVMILQKTCHDMDILAWLIGEKCTEIQSFGSLSYFTRENAPKDAPERCIDGCPYGDSCPYNAINIYYKDKVWMGAVAANKFMPTDDDITNALNTTQYGKCVFKCDNDVVDHQTVNMKFGNDVYVDFAMSAFNKGGRVLKIMGTKGEINARMSDNHIEIYDFLTGETEVYDTDARLNGETILGGHGGGDTGIILALRDMCKGKISKSVCDIAESCDNHMMSFAAEESRLTGKVIDMEKFCKRYEN
jgi:predicted dehydrogenase